MAVSLRARLRRILIEPPPGYEIGIQHKSRLLSIFLLMMIALFSGVDITYTLTVPGYVVPWHGYMFLLAAFMLNRLSYYHISAWLVIFMFPVVIFSGVLTGSANNPGVSLGFFIPGLIIASILLSWRGVFLLAVVNSLIILLLPRLASSLFPDYGSIVGPLAIFMIASTLILISMFHRDRVESDRQALLRQSEEKFRMLFEESPDGICIVNGENRILTANPTLLSMMGYSLDELIGRFASDFVAPEDIARRPLRTVDEFKVPGTVRHDRIAVRKDRRRLNVIVRSTYLPSGNLQYIIQDVTEQKRMEKSLRLSEERYRMVSSVISDYTFFTKVEEDDTLRMVWVGGAFEKITGYSPEEFEVHGGWISTLHPDDIPQDERDMAMLRSNQRIVSEVRTIRKDGATSWVRVYAHPMWDPDKHKLVGIYGAVQDINEQKRIEHERESLILQLEAKNAELEQFTYMVSHDLKAPIITIKGFLGFLSEDARNHNVERLQTDILRIGSAADKMHALLNDLLELSRIGRLINDPEPVDCRELVSEVEKLLSVRLKMRNITLRVGEQLPMLHGDRQRLFEVFQNLIENASKFMGEQQNPVIEVAQHGEPQDGMVTLYVRDNGIGIDPQHHDRVFGLFNRLDPQIDGTGVGLAIVRRIVEFHGGAVWLESAVGQGATFFFSLPCEK